MDLSKLSTEDLMALRSGDLSKVSTEGLMILRGGGDAPKERTAMQELGHGVGLAARTGINMLAGLPNMLTDAITGPLNDLVITDPKKKIPASREALNQLLTNWGLPESRNTAERWLSGAVEAGGDTGGTARLAEAGGRALAPLARYVGQQVLATSTTLPL